MTHDHSKHSALTPPDIEAPDEWHSHVGDEHPQKAHGEISNAHLIVLFGVGSFFIVFLCCVAVYAYYIKYSTEQLNLAEFDKAASVEKEALQYRRTAQTDIAQGYSWGDHEHVQLPIADAMQRIAKQYADRTPAPKTASKD